MGDALGHTSVMAGEVVVAVTGNIIRNILQRKSIHYINFLCLEVGIPLERLTVNIPGVRGLTTLGREQTYSIHM